MILDVSELLRITDEGTALESGAVPLLA
jgi:hypothetical protein